MMVWSLDTDDFGAKCLGESYKLLKNIVNELNDPTFVKRNISISKITTNVVVPTTEMVSTYDTSTMEYSFETTESTWSTNPAINKDITESTTQISTIGPKKPVKAKLKIKTDAKLKNEDEAVTIKNPNEKHTVDTKKLQTEQQTEKPPAKEEKRLTNQVQQSTERKRRKMKIRRRLNPEESQVLRRKVAGKRPIQKLKHKTEQQGGMLSKPTHVENNGSLTLNETLAVKSNPHQGEHNTHADIPVTDTTRTGSENEQASASLQNGNNSNEITLSKRIKVARKRQPEAVMTAKNKEQEQVAPSTIIITSKSSKAENSTQQDDKSVSSITQVNDVPEKSLVTIPSTPSTSRLTSAILDPTTQKRLETTPKETTTATPLTHETDVNQGKNDNNGRTKMRRRRKQKQSNVDQQANEAI